MGAPITKELFLRAAEAKLSDARTFAYNGFKVELTKRTVVGVLRELTEGRGGR